MPSFTAQSLKFAISYESMSSTSGIPGYDPFFLVMGLVLSVILLAKFKSKKKFKLK